MESVEEGENIPCGFAFGVAGGGFVAALYLRFGGIVAVYYAAPC
jgi:hypothetical protein